ncbi:MAG: uvrABC system protein [Chlamydiota bacterium]|jgi:excinuclease ABC subunit A
MLLQIFKARVHNLKNVDLTLKPHQLIVFTGVSGSGKSSLAFDTIYVEGQRRYIQSLSHQARRSLGDLPKPDADAITGIAPTIAIEQRQAGKNPRSTVGTMTGIYDFFRVLFARLSLPYCPVSQEPVAAESREKIIARLKGLHQSSKVIFLAPIVKEKKGECKDELSVLVAKGFTRARIDGEITDLSEPIYLDPKESHTIDAVIDRIEVSDSSAPRIAEAASTALDIGQGFFSIFDVDQKTETSYSQFAYSPKSNLSYGPLQPHDFSFNHPSGMCPKCHGLGIASEFNLDTIIDSNKSISEDCCVIASSYQTVRYGNIYRNLARIYKFDVETPWKQLSIDAKHVFLYGTAQKWTRMFFTHPTSKKRWYEPVKWQGVIHEANERLIAAQSDLYRKKMKALMTEVVCPSCHGSRIQPYPAAARLGGKTIAELTALTLSDCLLFFQEWEKQLTVEEQAIGGEMIREVALRLQFLIDVGLSYLALERTAPTLSGGESQRVRLAAQIGAGLVGAIYVLDEPSIGLHPTDHHKLIDTLLALRDSGNTVIVVEHDADTIAAADTVVDVGPGAGQHGGEILVNGSREELLANPRSITGGYLSGRLKMDPPRLRKPSKSKLTIQKAAHHNLQSIDVSIPLECLVCVTGVSGSGKSSLVSDIVYPALANHFHSAQLNVGKHIAIKGVEALDKVIAIDQSPIGRTPRSNPATYIKLFDEIRDLFAALPESKAKGFTPGHFSFNVKEGSCSYCGGLGQTSLDMDFMDDVWLECPQCKGKRFEPDVLSVQFKGHSIDDVLRLDVDRALVLFEAMPSIRKKLSVLHEVGLSYMSIGQPSTTLSGGEAQRIKLAKELVRPATGKTLYILDEPTTGLHFHDVKKLIAILQRLVDANNSVLVIEHNIDLIRSADWLIDLGPGPGVYGGRVVGEGPPSKIAKLDTKTGQALSETEAFGKKSAARQNVASDAIVIKGARENNLRGVDVSIPRGKITVFTGPSGSGKSSLAFDTIYAEGQRRYTETLSAYARTLVKPNPKPKVDNITGLLPSIALEQKTGGLNPRSTIGTITEVYDLLRILYAHLGKPHDPETKEPIEQVSKEFVTKKTIEECQGQKAYILAPLAFGKKETFEEWIARVGRLGFLRIRLNGVYYEVDEAISYDKLKKNELYLVIDRLVIHDEKRLFEAINKATECSGGTVIVATEMGDRLFNLAFAAVRSGKSYSPITPQTFSFNHESGMCLECQGLGATYGAQLEGMRRIEESSWEELADLFFQDKNSPGALMYLRKLAKAYRIDPDQSFKHLSDQARATILHGGTEVAIAPHLSMRWVGIATLLQQAVRIGTSAVKEALLPHMRTSACNSCRGGRLNPLASHVTIQKRSIIDVCRMNLEEALAFISGVELAKEGYLAETKSEIVSSLKFLLSLGLSYLTLERSAPTLSGGELQRIRLAKQLGSGLTSCLYVLDEPTIGLHPYNNEKLNRALVALTQLGNTLLLVEHDPLTIQIADYLVDFGPKAGVEGGKIVARGTIEEIKQNPASLTGQYLSGKKSIPIPHKRRPFSPDVTIANCCVHNLKGFDVSLPKHAITVFSGVSGSGKSSLMRHLLKPAVETFLRTKKAKEPFVYGGATFTGIAGFDQVISIDQSPIGQTARADVSTYSDVQPLIRSLFADVPLAKTKGLKAGHFSPNHLRGMCRTCWGLGYRNIDLQFLPSVRVACESCRGYRLNPISLEVHYKGKNFGQILQLTIDEASRWFDAIPRIAKRLTVLQEVGLGYLQLGLAVASLSGGEAQRLRLSRELAKRSAGHTLYLIDEPTVGLHSEDVLRLIPIFHRLAHKKHTLVIIEHNIDVIANADYVIDLGPDAGDLGGYIVAQGTPEAIAESAESKTAPYLAHLLRR